jgi:uridine kinase
VVTGDVASPGTDLCQRVDVPAGLDGNPSPIVAAEREAVLTATADLVIGAGAERTLVGVDGRSGSGKSTFADELAARVEARGRQVLRSTTDAFHRSRSERMRLGPTSAEGYYLESHQLGVIVGQLLEPFTRGASSVRVAAFDEPSDRPTHESAKVGQSAVLVFDGLFLQRPELEPFWHLTVLLEADDRINERWVTYLLSDLPEDASSRSEAIDERLTRARWPRYRAGWTRYAESVRPFERASIVIDNNDFAAPFFIRTPSRTG